MSISYVVALLKRYNKNGVYVKGALVIGDRILVRAVKGLISRAGMVSICPLLWQRDVKLPTNQPTLVIGDIIQYVSENMTHFSQYYFGQSSNTKHNIG